MNTLLKKYRLLHEQAFLPIFAEDCFESEKLVNACLEAGCNCIEYTLRRKDAHEMIPKIREKYPELCLLAGSTIDNEEIVNKMKPRYPQLLTVSQLAEMVDGFVSMMGWSLESISKYAASHIIIPNAMTVTESLQQVGAGAHFIKIFGTDLDFAKRCRGSAAFDFCPIMITGGMDTENIPLGIQAGAVIIGSGFDLILKEMTADISCKQISSILKTYIAKTKQTRAILYPELSQPQNLDDQQWLKKLNHFHPF